MERGHRTLAITRKDGKSATIPSHPEPPVPPTYASGNVTKGRSSSTGREANASIGKIATRIVKRLARHAGIDKTVSPHSVRQPFIRSGRPTTGTGMPRSLLQDQGPLRTVALR
jgi:hypothetical protein